MKLASFRWIPGVGLMVASLASAWVRAQPVHSKTDAILSTAAAVHRFELTSNTDECLRFNVTEKPTRYDIEVREHHGAGCGGSAATEPRLFTVRVRKQDGQLTSDAYDGVAFKPVDRRLPPAR